MFRETHTFICKVCGIEHNTTYQSEIIQNPIAKIPIGWCEFWDGFVCDNHIITITDKELEIINETILDEVIGEEPIISEINR
jgi:hypothetical protein